jgi:hypothetical protein
MSLWAKIETAPASAAFFSWKMRFGKALPSVRPWFLKKTGGSARTVPCPRGCGCIHRITKDNFGVCNCGDCEEIALTAEDVQVWEANWAGLGSRVRDALDLEHRVSPFPVARVWQVGSFGGNALRIVLVVQPDRTAFKEAMAQLVARVEGRFVVLVPTLAHDDIETRELLGRVNAGLVDLETNLDVLATGRVVARKTAGELFSPYLPDNQEAANATEATQVFGLLMSLKSKRVGMKAPLYDVFVMVVLEDKSQREAAKACDCTEGLMSARVKELRGIFDRSIQQLKALRRPILEMQTAVKGDRRRKRAPGSRAGGFAGDDKPDEEGDGAPKEEYLYDPSENDS